MYLDHARAEFERTRPRVNEVLGRDSAHYHYPGGKKPKIVVRGCTQAEVAALERRIGHTLPAAYREFLLWIGQSAGYLLQGSEVFYKDLDTLLEGAQEILEANNIATPLPDDAFVFSMHQGYQFSFFRLSEGDNPPAYYYGEGEGLESYRLGFARYSDFLEAEIQREADIVERIAQMRRQRQERQQGKPDPS